MVAQETNDTDNVEMNKTSCCCVTFPSLLHHHDVILAPTPFWVVCDPVLKRTSINVATVNPLTSPTLPQPPLSACTPTTRVLYFLRYLFALFFGFTDEDFRWGREFSSVHNIYIRSLLFYSAGWSLFTRIIHTVCHRHAMAPPRQPARHQDHSRRLHPAFICPFWDCCAVRPVSHHILLVMMSHKCAHWANRMLDPIAVRGGQEASIKHGCGIGRLLPRYLFKRFYFCLFIYSKQFMRRFIILPTVVIQRLPPLPSFAVYPLLSVDVDRFDAKCGAGDLVRCWSNSNRVNFVRRYAFRLFSDTRISHKAKAPFIRTIIKMII